MAAFSLKRMVMISLVVTTLSASIDCEQETVIVKKISGHINRRKRSDVYEFPKTITFEFNFTSGPVRMSLKKNPLSSRITPVYIIGSDNVRLHKRMNMARFSVYQDISLGASVVVRRPDTAEAEFHLFGSFANNGNHYQIEPDITSSSLANSDVTAGVLHRVRRQELPRGVDSFLGDELLPPAENIGLNRPESPPFPHRYK
ncbi:hypothetical protein DPMN_123313 [Dreissena polymorpha]|uniref:Uncharacterized protein n=1 Tax=Dreissena polymorpha TaxID=45954 RepID=A0A9D4GU67_DREPO|nr:hypothetical protein DPMN_123313 [Dreissena polymorpha]